MKHENYDIYFPDQPVVDLYLPIWANLPFFRAKPAFIWADNGSARIPVSPSLTYSELNTSVQSISSNLSLSLQRGDIVVILCPPSLEFVEIIFACQRAGLVAVPVNPPNPSFANDNHHHLVRVLAQTNPKAAIATTSYINQITTYTSLSASKNRLSDLLQTLKWISTEDLKGVKAETKTELWESYKGCKANDVYLIQYTSGATQIPKPVLVTAGAAAHNVRAAKKAYDLHPNSVIASWLPMYHDCGLMFLLLTIVSGATCVLSSPNAFINRPRLWLELITEYRATCTPVPSFTLPLVVRRGGVEKGTSSINLGSMKNLIIINEPILNTSIEEFVRVFKPYGLDPSSIAPSYGLAENCTFVSTAWRTRSKNDFPIYKKLLPSAKLASSNEETGDQETGDEETGEGETGEMEIEILIVNEETEEAVEDGVEGEIWISSPSNASGYLYHPSLTREIFTGRLRNSVSGGCFLRTGDRGIVIGEQRYLYVIGRCSDVIKISGDREIHPHYIEAATYGSCRKMLRAGCVAAVELQGTVVVVAELGRGDVAGHVLVKICEGIRVGVLDGERVEVGMVILVGSGSVAKTTSGKIQRWVVRYMVERGDLNVVMKMEFEREKVGKKIGLGFDNNGDHLSLISSSL